MTGSTVTTTPTAGNSISTAQQAANLKSASNLVAAQMGFDVVGMTYDQRLKYNRALATVIVKYPERFSEQAVTNAQISLKKIDAPLDDTGFDISAFNNEVVNNALAIGSKVADAANAGIDAV